ncbi:MAG TPA: hypothetical protein ENK05_10340 [Gammaproteobacteria bacterium]|nr:hypothetical protein [Gammaproteobacteria bacterium]
MIHRSIATLFAILLLGTTGCTVVHTVPLAARPGDTIIVSVGAPDDLSRDNTTLSYIPSGGTPIAIPDTAIRSIFKLYPDKTSDAWLYSAADLIENESGHGPWTTVLVVDLPGGPGDSSGITLPEGPGSLQISTTANYNGTIPSADGQNIALEILPGTGSPSSFDYLGLGNTQLAGDLARLEPMKKIEFRPAWTGLDSTNTYGAVEIRIGLDSSGIASDDFHIVVDDKIGALQARHVSYTWKRSRYETVVYFVSPTGQLQYSDVDFSLISKELQSQFETGAQNVANDVTVQSVIWYDIDGVVDPNGPPILVVNQTGT